MSPDRPGQLLRRAARIDVPDVERVAFHADYGDAFRIGAVPGATARDWARVSLRSAETANRLFPRLVWHGALGFDLAARDVAESMVGWRIKADEPQRLVLDTDGRLMAGRLVFAQSEETVAWTTLLRFHRPAGRRIWTAAGNVHRALVPRLLTDASRRLKPARPP